jgi:hypothetical protein
MTYKSFLQLYTFKQKILGQEVSDSLSMVIRVHDQLASLCVVQQFSTLPISDIDTHVESIQKCVGATLNHLCQFWYCIFSCLHPKLRTCQAGLTQNSPNGLCNLGRVSGGGYKGHTSAQRYLKFAWFKVSSNLYLVMQLMLNSQGRVQVSVRLYLVH